VKKPIALVTCYFQPNYGSQLQAYATQLFFDKIGVENQTIRIDGLVREINRAKYKYFLKHVFDANIVREKFGFVLHACSRKLLGGANKRNIAIRNGMFNEFSQSKFHLSRGYSSMRELHDDAVRYSAFVVGSDQLWLPSNIEADYYTLSFVPDQVPRISYATSFGVSVLPAAQAAKAAIFLKRFNNISVREQSGQRIVKELTGRDAELVCDPTLLFTAEEWNGVAAPERFYEEKYILCYFLGNNPEHRDFGRRLKAATGYTLVQIQHVDKYIAGDNAFADKAPYNAGPAEFVQLIRDAEYVLTDSFHATVFSTLFRKPVFTFRRFNSDSKVSTNSRIYSLMSLLGMEHRLLRGNEAIDEAMNRDVDFDAVHARLDGLRQSSVKFVENALAQAGIAYDRDNR
jgi:hypothetical protein